MAGVGSVIAAISGWLADLDQPSLLAPNSTTTRSCTPAEVGAWLVCLFGTTYAAFLVARFEVDIDHGSVPPALAVLGFLLAVYFVYDRWRGSPMLSNLCGALATLTWAGATAGAISLVGLRYRFPLIDAKLAAWDRVAGIDGPAIIAWSADHPFWSDLLAITYHSSFPLLFGLCVFLAFVRKFEQLWVLAFVFATTIILSTSISGFWPAKGAFAFFEYSPGLLERLPPGAGNYHVGKFDYFRDSVSPILSLSSLGGVVTFPSFHCCLALMTVFATWSVRWLFPVSLAWNLLVIISTVTFGGHYAIDLPAGALLWFVATVAAVAVKMFASSRPAN